MSSVQVNAPLFRLSLDRSSEFQRDVLNDLQDGKVYEPGTWHTIQQVIEPCGRDCIDIGAHVGILTCLIATTVQRPDAVHAFEPDGDNRKHLRRNLKLNGFTAVTVHEEVVCERDGPVMFFTCADTDGGHAIWNPARSRANWRTRRQGGTAKQMIATGTRLDTLNLSPQFIKIDVEGAEMLVLKGAKDTIERSRPTVILEINAFGLHQLGSDEAEVRQFFRDLGYTEYAIIDDPPYRKPMAVEETMQVWQEDETGAMRSQVFNMLFLP